MIFRPERMGRGRGQILNDYRPQKTFDHKTFTAQVSGYGADDAYSGPDYDPAYLIDHAMRMVARWRFEGSAANGAAPSSDRAPGFPEPLPLAEQHYEVVVPGRVFSRVWPLIVRCDECHVVYESDEPVHGQPWPTACPNGHTRARQLQFLLVHECGEVRAMNPPRACRRCQKRLFELDDRMSRFIDFRWVCYYCRDANSKFESCSNPRCTWDNKMMKPQVHTASSAYMGQGLTLVNVPDRAHADRRRTSAYTIGVLAHFVGACTQGELDRILTEGAGAQMPDAVRDALQVLEAAGLSEQANELRQRYAGIDIETLKATVMASLGFDLMSPNGSLRAASLAAQLDLFQRTLLRRRLTIADLEQLGATTARREIYRSYGPILARAGMQPEDTFLVTSFPVTRLAVGYTRSGFSPTDADLVPYKGRAIRGSAEKTLLFAHPTETEALVFTLDRQRLERWLLANNLLGERDLRDAGGLQRWLARELEDFDGQVRAASDPPQGTTQYATAAIYRLLHTVAHQFLRAIAVDSGFGEAALSEYLFPYNFAFAIYPNATSEFTIGGLRTVIEQVLGEVVNRALDNDGCLYDPNCYETDGADHGCLLLPETSCTGWNRDLARWYLFGGGPDRLIGYWNPVLAKPPSYRSDA